MRLTELDPNWIDDGWLGLPGRRGIGMWFRCPSHADRETDIVWIMFDNPLDGGPAYQIVTGGIVQQLWHREGDSLETITISPSIDGSKFGCWHGWIRNGEVTSA